ncbi:MAG: tetratricopeptide repeat protein [Flammeovirgaceae bacterium]
MIALFLLIAIKAINQPVRAVLHEMDTSKQVSHFTNLAAQELNKYPSIARDYAEKALKLAEQTGNQEGIALALSQIGTSYRLQTLYKPAVAYLLKAYRIYEELDNQEAIAEAHNEVGMIYWQQNDLEKSIKHHEAALAIAQEAGSDQEMAKAYKNLGVVHFYKKQYPEALAFYDQALLMSRKANLNELFPILYNNIGIVYAHLEPFEKALPFYKKALVMNHDLKNTQLEAAIYDNIGDVYRLMHQYDTAKWYLEKGLEKATEVQAINRMIESQESLYQLYQMKGDFQQALKHFQAQVMLKDSFINVNNSRQIAELRADYENRKKDRDIQLLKQSEELLKQEQKFDNLLMLALLGAMTSVIIISGLVFHWQRLKLWKRQQLIDRQAEEHQVREALVQASLANEKLAKEGLEREMDYKNQQISAHTLHIVQKQQFLEEMREQVLAISQKPTAPQMKKLLKQIDHRLNMNKEWEQINQTLDQVNASFFTRLQELCPALTPNELRICLLAKLNFSIKEMAMLLKIAPNSVAIARHRVRKKLNLPQEENLSKFMMNIC